MRTWIARLKSTAIGLCFALDLAFVAAVSVFEPAKMGLAASVPVAAVLAYPFYTWVVKE